MAKRLEYLKMKISRERFFFTAILIFYWISIVIATHIPVPNWVRGMGVSDKTMHFAAYAVLTLLTWLASSFDVKADWRKIRPLLILVIILFYGIIDELSQHFIAGRSTDIVDLISDLSGAAFGLLIVSFITGYDAAMVLMAIGAVFLPAIVHAKIIKQDSLVEILLYALAFAVITGVWIGYLSIIRKLDFKKFRNFVLFTAGPFAIMIFVKCYAIFTDKPYGKDALLSSFISILFILLAGRFIQGRKFDTVH
jgi:hypothetical protein